MNFAYCSSSFFPMSLLLTSDMWMRGRVGEPGRLLSSRPPSRDSTGDPGRLLSSRPPRRDSTGDPGREQALAVSHRPPPPPVWWKPRVRARACGASWRGDAGYGNLEPPPPPARPGQGEEERGEAGPALLQSGYSLYSGQMTNASWGRPGDRDRDLGTQPFGNLKGTVAWDCFLA